MEKWLDGLQMAYVAAIAITLLLTLVIYPLSKKVSDAKDKHIAETDARAAAALDAAAQAHLELAKLKTPRTITPEQGEAIVQAMREFEGQRYALSAYGDVESLNYAALIGRVLEKAGWVRVEPQLGEDKVTTAGGTVVGTTFGSRGLTVLIGLDNYESAPALEAFADVMNEIGLSCGKADAPALVGVTPKAITIDVGQKITD